MSVNAETLITPEEKALPGPGIYYDMPAAEYHALPYASNSRLKDILEYSPAHCKYNMQIPFEATENMLLGSIIHTAILEPHLLEIDYVTGPTARKNSNAYNAQMRQILANNPKATIVPEKLLEKGRQIKRGFQFWIEHNAEPRAIFERVWKTEIVLIFDWCGVRCKARTDADCPDLSCFVDLKKTQKANKHGFEKTITDYLYYVQAAFYLEGAAILGIPRDKFIFCAIEENPPHGIALYSITDRHLDAGRHEAWRALETWKRCEETGIWPGYPPILQDVEIKNYRFKEIEAERLNDFE